jgi:polyphosphate kinase
VIRQEGEGIRRYCHIGTGNYNATTARMYEDIGMLSADDELGNDLTDLFNYLTGYSRRFDYRRIIVAPATLRPRIIELIQREALLGSRGRIVWKLNNVVDKKVIDELYKASQAGVQIDLIVRAICCLRPGVQGLSENITVRSIVGRWLEHSRVYYFGAGSEPDGSPGLGRSHGEYYFGSADMMDRNLDRRVEVVVPVEQNELRSRLREILDVELVDDTGSWQLGASGGWHKVPTREGISAQRVLQERAVARSKRWRESEAIHGARTPR